MHAMQIENQQHVLNGDVCNDSIENTVQAIIDCDTKIELADGQSPLGQGNTYNLHGSNVFQWHWLIIGSHPLDFNCSFSKADFRRISWLF